MAESFSARVWQPDRFGPGVALLRHGEGWLEFRDPIETRAATSLEQVIPLLRWAEEQANTRWAVGWVAFEAAPAFDPAFVTHLPQAPLAVFAVYDSAESFGSVGPPRFQPFGLLAQPGWTEETYCSKASRLREMIGEGRVYQVNLTFPMPARANGAPADLFCALVEDHAPAHAALLGHGGSAILSLSPELFVRRQGSQLVSQPMKGTRPAGGSPDELAANPKDQAENLMIVDMVRNDLGRIAQIGSVRVRDLFHVAPHGSVLQMTSAVEAEAAGVGLAEVFGALFPCASVTGAPKVEALRVIHEMEEGPRGAYCGAIGHLKPGGDFSFNVAIRTLTITPEGSAYAVGSGVVWDSEPSQEWRECLLKAEALRSAEPWSLLETLLWKEGGFAHLTGHLERMRQAAAELGIEFKTGAATDCLQCAVSGQSGDLRVRLMLDGCGNLRAEAMPLTPWPEPLRAQVCPFPVRSDDPWLRRKSTRRGVFRRALAACPGCDEALLWNEREELCGFTHGNLVVEIERRRLTPPVDSGALPGVARAAFLLAGELEEQTLLLADLHRASRMWLINSVRGWALVKLVSSGKET